jgi:phospholipid N-methyltransferase
VGAVISGLPLLSMSPKQIMAILSGAFRCLRPGGSFYQFTYMPRCPISRRLLERLGLEATRIGGTLKNVPPAAVYRISRRAPDPRSA